jgi:hypothetical protein
MRRTVCARILLDSFELGSSMHRLSVTPMPLHAMFLNAALRRCVDMRRMDGNRERYCKHLFSPIESLTLLNQSPRPLAVHVHP